MARKAQSDAELLAMRAIAGVILLTPLLDADDIRSVQ